MLIELTRSILQEEARVFAETESTHPEPALFGVTEGKAVGTYFEQKFRTYLTAKYSFGLGNSAKGIDFPGLLVDMKVTSIKQPQSSCPFKSARQKIYGLGYSLLIFVYEKIDHQQSQTGTLNVLHTIFVDAARTADYQTTLGIRQILENDGNSDDLIAYMQDRNLPVDDMEARNLAEEILKQPPEIGYLTISNALQWRLQYTRVITKAGAIDGIFKLR
jgi:hypothetical protein